MAVRRLQIVEAIDWYDGIVLAIVLPSGMKGTYLASLLAFDIELRQRAITLLQIDEHKLAEIRSRLGGDWQMLISYLSGLWHNASGNVPLICYSDHENAVIAETIVEAIEIQDRAISDVEQTIRPDRQFWFARFHI